MQYSSIIIAHRRPFRAMPKRTYTISELASEFGVTTRTIRFYEEKGLISPLREGQKRLYTPADRVRIRLILRGKRIGMSLKESVELIDLYDPGHNNQEQLHSLLSNIERRRDALRQQQQDIADMLAGLDEIQALCERALAGERPTTGAGHSGRRPSMNKEPQQP
jgi:DNA-binding transcriptional MerR regulator